MPALSAKEQKLRQLLSTMAPLAVAFSGGVDSSLLLFLAYAVAPDRCLALTIDAPYHFRSELSAAATFARQLGVPHRVITFDPARVPHLLHNPPERCYLCKQALLLLCRAALPTDWSLVDGSNLDDQSAHRPGRQALQEQGVRSPLAEAGFTKQEVRELSRRLGLASWDKPAQSCLLTRFPHGHLVTPAELQRVEQCESAIQRLGFEVVRVRSIGSSARIECDNGELAKARLPIMEQICRSAGFAEVTLDPAGYRSGSMDQN